MGASSVTGKGTGSAESPIRGLDDTSSDLKTKLLLGAKINGTRDEMWLCAQAFSTNEDFVGALNWQEL